MALDYYSPCRRAVFSFCVDILPDALIDAAQIFPANPMKLEASTHNLNTAYWTGSGGGAKIVDKFSAKETSRTATEAEPGQRRSAASDTVTLLN